MWPPVPAAMLVSMRAPSTSSARVRVDFRLLNLIATDVVFVSAVNPFVLIKSSTARLHVPLGAGMRPLGQRAWLRSVSSAGCVVRCATQAPFASGRRWKVFPSRWCQWRTAAVVVSVWRRAPHMPSRCSRHPPDGGQAVRPFRGERQTRQPVPARSGAVCEGCASRVF